MLLVIKKCVSVFVKNTDVGFVKRTERIDITLFINKCILSLDNESILSHGWMTGTE